MASHKYKVGQSVRFRPTHMRALVGAQDCEIIRQLPVQDGAYLPRRERRARSQRRVMTRNWSIDPQLRKYTEHVHVCALHVAARRRARPILRVHCPDRVHGMRGLWHA
jgi:hypothetical protein